MSDSRVSSAKIGVLAAATAAAFFFLGRLSVEVPASVSPEAERRDGRSAALRYAARERGRSRAPAREVAPLRRGSAADAPSPIGPAPSRAAAAKKPPPELGALAVLIREDRALDAAAEEERESAIELAASRLQERLLSDPAAMSATLDRFMAIDDPAELGVLASILARIRDGEVETLALEAAVSDPSKARRIAALEILDGLDAPAARDVALPILEGEADVDLRRAAAFAVPEPRGASRAEAGRVLQVMSNAARRDSDPELRRRALLQIAAWHREPADLGVAVEALRGDASADVRAGAAFALELAGRREPSVFEALAASMRDSSEDIFVRETAWRALGRLSPLPEAAAQDYARFAAELARVTEGGGG